MLLRTNTVKEIKGGISAVLGGILEVFFQKHDLRTAGMSIQLHNGERTHLWFEMGPLISDEAAMHSLYTCKGAGGLKPCLLCMNVFNSNYRRDGIEAVDADGWAVFHQHHDHGALKLHTKGTITRVLARLGAPMTKTALHELETNLGWNHAPYGIMHRPMRDAINPVDHALFDWMHVFFVHGIFNVLVWAMLKGLQPHGITRENIRTYIDAWQLPKRLGSKAGKLADNFTKDRWAGSNEAKHLKCSASQGLTIMSILACFIVAILEGARGAAEKAHARVYLLCVHMVELLKRSAREIVSADEYNAVASSFLKAFADLYGHDLMTPKFHSSMHFGWFVNKWNRLPNCFCLERKHKMPKRWSFVFERFAKKGAAASCVYISISRFHAYELIQVGRSVHEPESWL